MKPAMDYLSEKAKKIALGRMKADAAGIKPAINPAPAVKIGDGNGCFSAGYAEKDITPANLGTHTYWMAGYNIAKKIRGKLDSLTVRAMWIDCGGDGIVLVSCDLIGLTGYEVGLIRKSLEPFCRRTGCRHITVSCTHTHAGIDTMGYWGPLPKTGKDKAYMEFVKKSVAEVCEQAFADRRPGKMYYGGKMTENIASRWREPKFCVPLLHRIRFVPDDGSRETWYVNFPAHPNTLGGKNTLLSADYPCYMRREINLYKDVNVVFTVGAIGATDIADMGADSTEQTMLGGAKLGKEILSMTDERELKPEITVVSQNFVMPIDNYVLALANAFGVFNTIRCACDSETGVGFISEITYISIGDAEILTMPGETFQELVYPGGYCDENTSANGLPADVNPTPLTEIFGSRNLIISGVTNDMAGYALARNDFVLHETQPFMSRGTDRFGRNHYHETNSCGIETGDVLADTCKIIKATLDGRR